MIDRKTTRTILTIATVAYVLCAGTIGLLAPKALIGLDKPGQGAIAWIYAVTVMSFPVVLLVSAGAGWALYRMKEYRNALVVLLMPLANIVIVGALFASHQ